MTPIEPMEGRFVAVRGWLPTKKWWAALLGSAASVAASWIVTGAFDDVERGMVGTALVALVAAYFKGNDDTPGGVPDATLTTVSRPLRDQAGLALLEAVVLLLVVAVVVLAVLVF